MTAGSFGSAQANGADRENARAILQRAYAEGRLSQADFESRSAHLDSVQTQEQLAGLTADLRSPTWGAPPQAHSPQGYAPQGYAPGQGAGRPTNQLAIAALVCAIAQIFFWFLTGIPAVILGHMARRQIRRTGENGDGMALAGLILGYIGVGLSLVSVAVVIIILVAVHRQDNIGLVPGQ